MKQQLRSRYDHSKLYTVAAGYKPASAMDITASQGDMIAVIQQKNPMGDESSWFVDNGCEYYNMSEIPFQSVPALPSNNNK